MTNITVADFANELKRPTDTLMEQLQAAGVSKQSASDALTDADKQKLLNYLQASHGTDASARRKITLTKKTTSEIKQADATGKARTIQVEVRKKRTFIKRDEDAAPAPAPAVEPPAPAPAPAPAMPVVDAAGGLVGLLSHREVERAAPSAITTLSVGEVNYLMAKVTVGQVMRREVITCGPRAQITPVSPCMI